MLEAFLKGLKRSEEELKLEFEDFELLDYQHHPVIKFPVAV